MIEIKKAFQSLTPDELKQLTDTPVWLSLLAALSNDGIISVDDRAEAVRLAHLRTFTSPKSLQEFYALVNERFAERFDQLQRRLPESDENKELYIEAQIKSAHHLLLKLDPDVLMDLEKSLESFYKHVFRSSKSFFQYFAIPIFSSKLDKSAGKFEL